MDPLSHGVLGALVAQAASRPRASSPALFVADDEKPRRALLAAAVVGFGAGLLPDVDVFIRSDSDPLLFLQYHRHFTHALLFIPLGALIAALLFYLPMRRRMGFAELYLYAFLGYGMHGFLDACTSYGTQLLWPFSDLRVSWSIIAVIDPLFTLPLLAAMLLAVQRRTRMWALLGLGWALLYLGAGWVQRERAELALRALAEDRGHHVVRVEAKPTLFNLLLWRGIYESEGYFHAAAVRPGLRSTMIWRGGSAPRFEQISAEVELGAGSTAARDLARFKHFSQGWTYRQTDEPWFIGDFRYSLLPASIQPLWGVSVDPDNPDAPAVFENRRNVDADTWARFGCKLRGQCPEAPHNRP